MLLDIGLLILGLTLLSVGADAFVKGASNLALNLGVAPIVIGLTVVAFGTSAPEFLVTLDAASAGSPDLSLGNIVGSNICNIVLILGISALIRPMGVDQGVVRREYPIMLVSSSLLFIFAATDGVISHLEGGVLLLGIVMYLGLSFLEFKRGRAQAEELLAEVDVDEAKDAPMWKNVLGLFLGLGGLVVGADLVVQSAVVIAKDVGISDFVIAVTVLALGTSLPELAASVAAARQGQSDIILGNVVGSNIFNVMMVLGLVPMLFGLPVQPRSLTFDFPIMIGITLFLFPVMRSGFVISRAKGAVLLSIYIAYMIALVVVRGA